MMKKEIILYVKNRTINILFLFLLLFCGFILYTTDMQVRESYKDYNMGINYFYQVFRSLYFIIPYLLGIICAVFMGQEYMYQTIHIRNCHQNITRVNCRKLIIQWIIAFATVLLVTGEGVFFMRSIHLSFLINCTAALLIYSLLFINIAAVISLLTRSEIWTILSIAIFWVVELRFSLFFMPKSQFMSFVQDQYMNMNITSVEISSSLGIVLIIWLASLFIFLVLSTYRYKKRIVPKHKTGGDLL